mgnify:CR=1 FL=1|jgi:hypothetical protein
MNQSNAMRIIYCRFALTLAAVVLLLANLHPIH